MALSVRIFHVTHVNVMCFSVLCLPVLILFDIVCVLVFVFPSHLLSAVFLFFGCL